jgi:hypothetical protein
MKCVLDCSDGHDKPSASGESQVGDVGWNHVKGRVVIMAPTELEARLVVLEREVARLKSRVEGTGQAGAPWWERIAGTFADDPAHEKAMKLGREYRASLRPGKARAGKG